MKTMQGLKKEPLIGPGVSLLHHITTRKLSPSALSPEKIRGPHVGCQLDISGASCFQEVPAQHILMQQKLPEIT